MLERLLSGLSVLWTGLGSALAARAEDRAVSLADVGAAFAPRFDPSFPPLYAILQKDGEPFPAVVEVADLSHARAVLDGPLHTELQHFLEASRPFEAVPWIAIVRGLDGTPEGLALSWLTGRGPGTRMRCERAVKRVIEGDGQVHRVGIALLMVQLRWMKAKGYWSSGDLLTHYDPMVMAGYRRVCGMPKVWTDDFALTTASVDRGEGEGFLKNCPIEIREITPTR